MLGKSNSPKVSILASQARVLQTEVEVQLHVILSQKKWHDNLWGRGGRGRGENVLKFDVLYDIKLQANTKDRAGLLHLGPRATDERG